MFSLVEQNRTEQTETRKFFANWCLFSCIHFHIVWNLFASADFSLTFLLSLFFPYFLMIWLNDILSGILDKINNKRNSTENGKHKTNDGRGMHTTRIGEQRQPFVRYFLTLISCSRALMVGPDDSRIWSSVPHCRSVFVCQLNID